MPWLLALAVATCSTDQGAPSESGVGYFSFRPVYHLAGGASLSQFGIVADSVRIKLTRPVAQLVLDTTIFFPPDSASLRLALPVELQQSPETLTALITISAGGIVLFTDSIEVEVKDGPSGSTTPPTVVFDYVGPGSTIKTLAILPSDTTVSLQDTLFFAASAIDSQDVAVPSFYVHWTSTDTLLAKVNAGGRLIVPPLRGSVRVIGTTPTGIADTTLLTFAPVPVTIYADSGTTQLGIVGDSLAALLVARVMGADSLGIAGISVRFQSVTAGGAVRDTVVVTDAQGRARTRGVLGVTAGAYGYTATALGTLLPATTFTGSAGSAAASAILITGGNGQVDTTGKTLGIPLSVNVRDGFGNPVGGAMVIFTRTAGSGTVGNDTVLTAVDGDASTTYTLGAIVGIDSINAQLAGTSASVVFTATGVSNLPTQIIQGLGGSQTAVVGTLFTDSLTVQVLDNGDNPVGAVMVQWAVASGTATLSADSTLTDVNGRAAVALTAGTLAGPVDVVASVAGIPSPTTFSETVTAGAPASMVISSGNGQTGTAGSGLALAPEVLITDAFSNPVTGLTVDFAVTAGGGSIDSATATTDPTGRANAGLWTLGLAGLNQVRATTTAVPADTLLFDATSTPSGTSKLWTGAVDNLFTTAGNWSPSGMPVGGDNIFIPIGPVTPVLNTPIVTGGLAIESGAQLSVTAGVTLQLSGNLDLDGALTGAGNLALTGSGTTLSGNISLASVLANGTLSLNGATTISGPLNVNTGTLTVGGQTLSVGGALTVGGSGQLLMGNAADSVDVGGNATISSSTSGTGDLSAGVLVLRGNFSQTGGASTGFAPSGTHRTRFLGSGTQAISFANPGSAFSRFQGVEFGSAAGTTINSTVTVMGTASVSAGTVTGIGRTINIGGGLVTSYSAWQVSTTLWGQNPTVYPDSLPRNVTVFNAWTLTKPFKTDSSLSVNSSGVLTLGGHALRVGGTLTQSGVLSMSNAADSLDVQGLFTINSGISGVADLSDGVIVLRGGLTQTSGATNNFQPSATHRVRFLGSAPQVVSFSSSGVTNSRFAGVEFGDVGGVTLASNVYAAGATAVTAGTVTGVARTATLAGDLATSYSAWQVSSTLWVGTPAVYPDSLPRNVSLGAALTLNKAFRVDSALTISPAGLLALNGHALRVGRGLTQTGQLSMQDPADTLDVGGLFTVNSGFSGSALMTEGLLRLRGGLTQSAGAPDNFHSSGNQIVRFEAGSGQAVSIGAPGAANSAFQFLEVGDSINVASNIYVAGNVTLLPGGKVLGNTTATLAGDLLDPSDSGWRYATTQLIGTPTTLPDSMVTNLVLPGSWALARRTVVNGTVTVTSSGSLALNGDSLRVTGAFTQTGTLTMADPADLLDVGGIFTVNSGVSSAGKLTAGRLLLRGGFAQAAGAPDNFAPSASQITEFAGVGGHALTFSSPSAANSHFQELVVADSLTVTGNVSVTGNVVLRPTGRMAGPNTGHLLGALVDSSLAGWRMATTSLDGKFQLLPSALVSNVLLNDSIALAQPTTVTGNFTLQNAGYIAFGGHGLGVSGNFNQNATLEMNSTQDSLEVGGNFLVSSGNDGTGKLTAGVLVLRGGLSQSAGSVSNFVGTAPHRVRLTGATARTISFGTAAQSTFGDLEVDATGVITLNSAVNVTGTFSKPAGAVSPFTGGIQRLLRVGDLAVDGASFDRVRLEMHATGNAAQFDNVTFTNQDLTQTQLSLELPGQTGDTLKFSNVAFAGTPTTGHYVFVADSVANDGVATIGFYNSTPLNGALYTATEGTVGDLANVLWSHLDWVTQPTDGIQLFGLLPAPQVGAFDASGLPLATFTGTVTLAFLNNPVGALLGNNSVAAVGGVATFDSLTLNLTAIGFTLQASAPGLGLSPASAPFGISVPLPVGTTTAFNNGGGDNDWFNAANWTAGVPDSADNAFVYPGQTVAVNSAAQVNRLIVSTGAGVLLNAPLTADSSVVAGHTISGGGQLVARGAGLLSGVLGGLVVNGNYLVPVNDTLTADFINISGATAILDPGSSRIVAIDSLRTEAGGRLDMNDAGAVVQVQGLARFTGGAPALVAGTLEIGGDFSQEENVGAFSPSPSFLTVFNGGGTQTATFFSPDSTSDHFGDLRLTGGGTLHLATNTTILGSVDIQGGHLVADSLAVLFGTLNGATGAFMEGNTLRIRDNFAFGGVYTVANTIFIGTGQTIQQAITPFDTVYVEGAASLAGNVTANVFFATGLGQFALNGHRLDVTADFGTSGGGTFTMTSGADSLFVGGTFYAFGGSTAGLLTNGLLQIAGSFYQGGIPNSVPSETQGPPPGMDGFRADGGHTTRFVGGTGPRTIFFGSPVQPADPFSTANSRFGRLELVDGIDSLGSSISVAADLFVDSAHVVNAASLSGGPAVAGNVQVGTNVPEFTITNVSLGGTLDFQATLATYQVGTTLFFGDGQTIPVLPYQSIEVVLGQATLGGNISATNVKTGVSLEGPGFPGDLRLGGHTLTLAGGFTTTGQGTFTMDDPADSLDVAGNMDLGGGVTTALTAGTLVARGDMYLQDSNFVASGTHRTVMAAPLAQQLWITTAPTPSDQFNFLTVVAGTTVNFNAFSVGPLVVKDSFAINGHFVQANPGKSVIALGDLYIGAAAGLTVDTVELHKSLDVDLSIYSTQLTRYAGTGQIVSRTTSYHDLEVTGTAALDSTITVTHDFSIRGSGVLDLAGHTLAVAHDLFVADSGLLPMTSAADTVNVGYTATFDGRDSEGWLTAGDLITNYLVQQATTSPKAFRATGSHRTELRLQDPNDQSWAIRMATPGDSASQFQELIFDNGGVGFNNGAFNGSAFVADSLVAVQLNGADLSSYSNGTVTVAGPLVMLDPVMNANLDTLELRGTLQVPFSSLGSNVTRFAGINQQIPDTQNYQRIEVTGTASLETGGGLAASSSAEVAGNGQLTLGPNMTFISNGPFTTTGNGTVAMTDPTAELRVFGTATFGGGSTGGKLTDGILRLYGDLVETAATSDSAFHPAATHLTLFEGDHRHTVAFGSPNLNYGSNFGALQVTSGDTLDLNGGNTIVFGRTTVDPSGAIVDGPRTGTFEPLGPLAAGTAAVLDLGTMFIRDSLSVDPSATYTVDLTGFAFYTLPVPALSYTNIRFEMGAPVLGASITASGAVDVTGDGFPMDLRFNGFRLTAGTFGTSVGGALIMDQPTDSLIVTGDAFFRGGSELGKLVAGALVFGGNLTQDTAIASPPSSFVTEGTTVEFTLGPTHQVHFATPDSSFLPGINSSGAGALLLQVIGRARIAGGLSAYGLDLTGDTLWVDGELSGGPAGASAKLTMLRTGTIYGGTSFSTYIIGTTQFTDPGFLMSLPYDTLVVSDTLRGSYSQLVTANRLVVTGPGNPIHVGPDAGWLFLQGGDGNTTIDVTGDAIVSGTGATIYNNRGVLSTTKDLLVEQGGLLVATATGCCGTAQFNIGGNATFDGASTKDSLTGGQLVIGGDFLQQASLSSQSYAPAAGFVTRFTGSGSHKVTFATPSMAQSHFGTFAVDSGITAPNVVDLQTWAFADTVAVEAAGATFRPGISGNGNRLTAESGRLFGVDVSGVELVLTDQTGAFQPTLDDVRFSGYGAYTIPQLTVTTVGFLSPPVIFSAIDFDNAAPSPWLVLGNSGISTVTFDIHTPDAVTSANYSLLGLVLLNILP